jgi:uncharacterized phage protein (TIGR02218 family)
MKNVSSALKTHFAGQEQTLAQCLLVVLKNGTSFGFTTHDQTITISGWTGAKSIVNGIYRATEGLSATAVQTSAALNVDTTEIEGPQVSPSIIEDQLVGGYWDFARFYLFTVNYKDLSDSTGCLFQRVGKIGEVTVEGGHFKSEVRGLMQEYTKTICELTTPGCRANFGDSRCKVALGPYTYLGTVASVNADNMTFYDSGLTQSGGGPASVAITNVANSNPCIITTADNSLNLITGQAITIAGIIGPTLLNVVTVVMQKLAPTQFSINVDTTDTFTYPPYVSGGTVTPYGGSGTTAGFFDGGKVTFNSGNNANLSEEVKTFVTGQVTLVLPMPYTIVAGDTYTIIRGCQKTLQACMDYSNVVNFVGEPYVRGIDELMQVGRHQ